MPEFRSSVRSATRSYFGWRIVVMPQPKSRTSLPACLPFGTMTKTGHAEPLDFYHQFT